MCHAAIMAGVKVALVEDSLEIASFVARGLEAHGFTVEHAADGERGLQLALREDVDIVVLDLGLPLLAGDEVLRRLRARRPDVPVLVLTARDAVEDRVAQLDAGADDYLVKPFSFSELLARINARLRPRGQAPGTLAAGNVVLDLTRRQARVGDRTVELTAREFALLEVFVRNAGAVLSHAQLEDRVWGYGFDGASNVVEVYVGYLRRKLGAGIIETVRGMGYRLAG